MNAPYTKNHRDNAFERALVLTATYPLIIDTETTGLDEAARIVDICVIDQNGNVLINSLVNPETPIPAVASAVHGISDEMVKDAPTWPQIYPQLVDLLAGRGVCAYNSPFDQRLVAQMCKFYGLAVPNVAWGDVMEVYSMYYGEWDEYHGNFRWHKLTKAVMQMGIDAKSFSSHRAKDDCEMTRLLLRKMLDELLNAPRIVKGSL